MKECSHVRASHVNSGTSFERTDLRSNRQRGREFRHPKLHVAVENADTTAYGGLALAARLVAGLRMPQAIDEGLLLLAQHRPFHESDHVLTHVYNLFVGGTSIEDIGDLQHSEPVRRLIGAQRIPDPTTCGDFLRRFDESAIAALDEVVDRMHEETWKRHYGRKKQALGIIDLDSHVHHVYGDQKEGADFTYKGGFGYHPLVLSLAGTGECLRIVNRPGNVVSPEGAAEELAKVAPLVQSRFRKVLVRGDSAFAQQGIYDVCEASGMSFALVSPAHTNLEELAESIPQGRWQVFRTRDDEARRASRRRPRRRRGRNLRRRAARKRGKRDLKLERQWVTEIPYRPARSQTIYRLIIRRQRIEEASQGELFEVWRYRYVITNLPMSTTPDAVVRLTYRRCDQENVIEQLQHGVAAMRMPTGGFLANSAFTVCARIAHNLKAWLAMLALPPEVMRWEWKRFRKAFVFVAARVVRRARQIHVAVADSHRFADAIRLGIVRLQT